MQKYAVVAAGIAASLVLGATVFKEQVAWAAQTVDATITNVDANGNVKVHEQGTANVQVQGTPTVSVSKPVLRRGHQLISLVDDPSLVIPAGVVVTDIHLHRAPGSNASVCYTQLFENNAILLTGLAPTASQPDASLHLESGLRSTRDAQLSLFIIVDCLVNALWTGYEE